MIRIKRNMQCVISLDNLYLLGWYTVTDNTVLYTKHYHHIHASLCNTIIITIKVLLSIVTQLNIFFLPHLWQLHGENHSPNFLDGAFAPSFTWCT